MKVAVPTVHLNGTGGKQLQAQLRAQAEAIQAAIDALAANAPHGRDYYVQHDDAYSIARAQHDARLAALRKILEELATIHDHVTDQLNHTQRSK